MVVSLCISEAGSDGFEGDNIGIIGKKEKEKRRLTTEAIEVVVDLDNCRNQRQLKRKDWQERQEGRIAGED